MLDYAAAEAPGAPARATSSNMRVSFNPSAFGMTGKPDDTR